MHDMGKIAGGLVVFLALATSPLWYNALSASPPSVPKVAPPPNGSTQCVESAEFMRANHMQLLDQWRNDVVRVGLREYRSTLTGKSYEMSLTRTCLDCHSNKAEFCDRCHNYLAVGDPYCFSCHVAPKEGQ